MAQKTQQIARLPRSSNPICLTRQALNRLAYPPSGRAASTNSTDIRYPSNVLPEPKPQLLSQSLFQSTSPIRRVVEPASIDTARSMHLRRSRRKYAYFPPSGNSDQSINGPYSEPSVMRLNPGQKVRRVGPRVGPRVGNVDPFRDIYYVPPKRAGKTWNSPLNSKNTQQYSNNNPPAEPQNRFHPQATSTVPYRNPALRRFPKQQPLFPQQHQKSNLSTSSTRLNPVPSPSPETIDIDQYHRLADHYIDNLVTKLEAIQERRDEVDCEYTAGVLTLAFPPVGTYVLNKQPPNRQIWLSSPISGPKRYDYVAIDPAETDEGSTGGDGASRAGAGVVGQEKRGNWVNLRDGSTLSELLKDELGVDLDEKDVG